MDRVESPRLLRPDTKLTYRPSAAHVLFYVLLFVAVSRLFFDFFIHKPTILSAPFVKIRRNNRTQLQDSDIWPGSPAGTSLNRMFNEIRFVEQYARSSNKTVRSMKTILIVGAFYFDFNETQRAFAEKRCPISECTFTLDADRYRKTADAILIVTMYASKLPYFLPKPAHQIWIAQHWESPLKTTIDTNAMGHYINWSSSYRHDSHIVTPYGHVERISPKTAAAESPPKSSRLDDVNYAAGKTKQVAWIVSNCHDRSGRKNYVFELKRYIGVDIYGKCGTLECPRDINGSPVCFDLLSTTYKFYLAFENANCDYYITEKLFHNALRHNVIPVVMGARLEHYAASLPPHSYIHVEEFRSPRHLADYLLMLDKNDTMYNEYFRWKSDWIVEDSNRYSFDCRLCGLLHVASEQNYVHWYSDYSRWWNGQNGSSCRSRWTKNTNILWWESAHRSRQA